MALGGALFELESVLVGAAGRAGRLVGHGMVVGPARRAACRGFRRRFGQGGDRQACRTARHWFGYVAIHSFETRRGKGQDRWKLSRWCKALEDWSCRPRSLCSPARSSYRSRRPRADGDIFVGEVHPPEGDPDNLFTVAKAVPGEEAAGRSRTPAARWSIRPDRSDRQAAAAARSAPAAESSQSHAGADVRGNNEGLARCCSLCCSTSPTG